MQIIDKEWDFKLQFITKSTSERRTRKIRSEHAHHITSIKVSAWVIVCFIFIAHIFYEYFICIQILSKFKVRQKKPHEKTDNFDNEDWNKSLVLNVL